MSLQSLKVALLAGLGLLALSGLTVTQHATAQQAAKPPTPAAAMPVYHPGLGDLMTMTVQPRHIKLFMAGKEGNWFYAAYELHELQEAFDRVGATWPKFGQVPIHDMIEAVTTEPMMKLSQTIKDQDQNGFMDAYTKLTQACNTCHTAANRSMVSIQVPDTPFYPDQNFKPKH